MGALSVLTFQLNAVQVIVDDTGPDNVVVSAWLSATGATAHFGAGSQYASVDGGVDSFRFVPNLPFAGAWRVEAWNSCFSPRATNVPHVVSHTGGTTVVEVDQDPATGSCGDWALLGDFSFDSGAPPAASRSMTRASSPEVTSERTRSASPHSTTWRSIL